MLFSTGCSWSGVPPLPLRISWRSLSLHSPLSGLSPSLFFELWHRSCWGFGCLCRLQQVVIRSLDLGHLIAYFQWRRIPLHWEDNIEGHWAYFHIFASLQQYLHCSWKKKLGLKPNSGQCITNSPKRPLKERGGIPDQEHPVLNNTLSQLNSKRKIHV